MNFTVFKCEQNWVISIYTRIKKKRDSFELRSIIWCNVNFVFKLFIFAKVFINNYTRQYDPDAWLLQNIVDQRVRATALQS